MADISMHRMKAMCVAFACASIVNAFLFAGGASAGSTIENLALHRPAFSSSIENDEHSAAAANDGDPQTCWRADDEPEGTPDWWMVDLQTPARLAGCHVTWPFDGMRYQYKIEGSSDRKAWLLLSDQTRTESRAQVHRLKFEGAPPVRYVKITVTGLDPGCAVSIAEVKLFGAPSPAGESK